MRGLRLGRWSFVRAILYAIPVLSLLVSIGLRIYGVVFASKPGPNSYSSHFCSIFFSVCLTFQSIGLIILFKSHSRRAKDTRRHWRRTLDRVCSFGYWGVLTLSGFICLICYAIIPTRDERIAIQFLIFLLGAMGVLYLSGRLPLPSPGGRMPLLGEAADKQSGLPTLDSEAVERSTAPVATPTTKRKIIRWLKTLLIWVYRLLCGCNAIIAVFFIAGAIVSVLNYKYENPGQLVSVTLPSQAKMDISYHCESAPGNGTVLPTIWFESSIAHGVVDFLPIQTILATTHNRNSCSYDPANFGWSSRLPSSETDFYAAFRPLLDSIGQRDAPKVFVGWAGGIGPAIRHAISEGQPTKGLVLLDAAPYGIEWLWHQREKGLTKQEMLEFRTQDLTSRVSLAKIILALAIPWGLMPALVPSKASTYLFPELYPRYRAQTLKEDMWAGQYFALLRESSSAFDSPDNVSPAAPSGVPTYAIMTYNSGQDTASNDFYRDEKLKEADRLAGGKLAGPVTWCKDDDCSLDFPVFKAEWAAQALVNFGI